MPAIIVFLVFCFLLQGCMKVVVKDDEAGVKVEGTTTASGAAEIMRARTADRLVKNQGRVDSLDAKSRSALVKADSAQISTMDQEVYASMVGKIGVPSVEMTKAQAEVEWAKHGLSWLANSRQWSWEGKLWRPSDIGIIERKLGLEFGSIPRPKY